MHPRASCQPPTGTSITPATGTGGATDPKTSGGTTPQVGPDSTNLPSGKSTSETGAKGGTGAQMPTPPPGGPDATPRPSENAPPIGPLHPLGSISAPTPDAFPGVQRFNYITKPLVVRDDDEGYSEWIEIFTFEVSGDERDKDYLLGLPFFEDKDVEAIPASLEAGFQVIVSGGVNPGNTYEFLKSLQNRGAIRNLESDFDVCWRAAAGGPAVPVAGALVLYTPVSPSPSSDPGCGPVTKGRRLSCAWAATAHIPRRREDSTGRSKCG